VLVDGDGAGAGVTAVVAAYMGGVQRGAALVPMTGSGGGALASVAVAPMVEGMKGGAGAGAAGACLDAGACNAARRARGRSSRCGAAASVRTGSVRAASVHAASIRAASVRAGSCWGLGRMTVAADCRGSGLTAAIICSGTVPTDEDGAGGAEGSAAEVVVLEQQAAAAAVSADMPAVLSFSAASAGGAFVWGGNPWLAGWPSMAGAGIAPCSVFPACWGRSRREAGWMLAWWVGAGMVGGSGAAGGDVVGCARDVAAVTGEEEGSRGCAALEEGPVAPSFLVAAAAGLGAAAGLAAAAAAAAGLGAVGGGGGGGAAAAAAAAAEGGGLKRVVAPLIEGFGTELGACAVCGWGTLD